MDQSYRILLFLVTITLIFGEISARPKDPKSRPPKTRPMANSAAVNSLGGTPNQNASQPQIQVGQNKPTGGSNFNPTTILGGPAASFQGSVSSPNQQATPSGDQLLNSSQEKLKEVCTLAAGVVVTRMMESDIIQRINSYLKKEAGSQNFPQLDFNFDSKTNITPDLLERASGFFGTSTTQAAPSMGSVKDILSAVNICSSIGLPKQMNLQELLQSL